MEERPGFFPFFFLNRKKQNQTFNTCSWGGTEAALGVLWHILDKKGEDGVLDFRSEDEWLTGSEEELNTPGKNFRLGSSGTMGHREHLANRPLPEALLFTRLNSHWATETRSDSPPGLGFVPEPPKGPGDCKAAYLVCSVSSHCTYQDHEQRNYDSNAHVCQRLKKKISRCTV